MTGSSHGMSETIYGGINSSSSKGTIELMNQINQLGWHHIVSLDESMTKVEMTVTERGGRRHKFDVNLGSNYPNSIPVVNTGLAVPVHVNESSLSSIMKASRSHRKQVCDII